MSLASSQINVLGKRLAKDTGLGPSEQKCAELGSMSASNKKANNQANGKTRFRAVTATHTPGSLELKLGAKPVSSESIDVDQIAVLEDVVEVAEKNTLIMAPKSMSVSIAANGKETDQFAGAKYDCNTTKGATSGANFSKQVKEKRSRAGRPPKNSNQQTGTVKE